VVECDLEGGGANGYTGPQVNAYIAHVADGWGDPELRIIHSTKDFQGNLTQIWSHDFPGSGQDELVLAEEPATFGPNHQFTVVEVVERDGFLTGNDDYWGRTDVLSASGTFTKVYGQCGSVFVDGNWASECASYPPYPINPVWTDRVLTTEIKYYY
jgi:hypothetical protein